VGRIARMGRGDLVVRPRRKRTLVRPRRRWEDNINMDLQGVGLGGNGLG